jgi:hypothetical protein
MNHFATAQTPASDDNQANDKKRRDAKYQPVLTLIELNPSTITEGKRVGNGYQTPDTTTTGAMRETCPVCKDVNLQLVLRQEHVKIAHLFCTKCTRCYDARYPDGSCALSIA